MVCIEWIEAEDAWSNVGPHDTTWHYDHDAMWHYDFTG